MVGANLEYAEHHYGSEHELQKLGIWQFPAGLDNASGRWIIFVHGGAWRDPANTINDFLPSVHEIVKSKSISKSEIRGFVSIDYRLSGNPEHLQDPSTTPTNEIRQARHPDHIRDVWSALDFLQRNYDIQDQYILIGHSAGATLAFQLLMGSAGLAGDSPPSSVRLPRALIGISGIYEFYDFNVRHGRDYTSFLSGAFGDDQSVWKDGAPMRFPGRFRDSLTEGRTAVLAWSPEDTLIDKPEIDGMAERLADEGIRCRVVKDLTGEHDSIWQEGVQIARLVEETLVELRNGGALTP